MATPPAIGTTHNPYLLNAPENLLIGRRLVTRLAEKLSGKPFRDPPDALAAMGEDPKSATIEDHRQHWEAFGRLRAYVDEVAPDAILIIGDDQGQCFQPNNLPPYALYVGEEVDASPYYNCRLTGDDEYVAKTWGVSVDHTYRWPCQAEIATALRDGLIRSGFDVASTNDLAHPCWEHGLGHAHANTQLFLRNDDGHYPIIPLIVNCYGRDLNLFGTGAGVSPDAESASGYPPAATSRRLYDLGRAIGAILDRRSERVLVCASSTWSHTWLASRFDRTRMDSEGNLEKLDWLIRGEGERLADYDSPGIEANGDHELRNWIVAAGIVGARPFEVTFQTTSWVSTGFRVFGIWR